MTQKRIVPEVEAAERLHDDMMARIANDIAEQYDIRGVRIAAIAGPSSSGKTTFAQRLCDKLKANGIEPVQISLDDYFIDRELTPRDADGNYDFEALECVDLELLDEQLSALIAGRSVIVPLYDFLSGHRRWHDESLALRDNSVIVIEGLHALNPALLPSVPQSSVYGLFVSVERGAELPDGTHFEPTDVRLLRRIVRDNSHRGHSAAATIGMWASVRRGEEKYIFPFIGRAAARFDSGFAYEPGVLRTKAEPLLLQITEGDEAYCEAQRLLAKLRNVEPLPADIVPETSLLREFVS